MPLNCKIYCNLFSNPDAFLAKDFHVLFLKFLVERVFSVSSSPWMVTGTCLGLLPGSSSSLGPPELLAPRATLPSRCIVKENAIPASCFAENVESRFIIRKSLKTEMSIIPMLVRTTVDSSLQFAPFGIQMCNRMSLLFLSLPICFYAYDSHY